MLLAIGGGYALAAMASAALALLLPLPQVDAALIGMMASFAVCTGAAVLAFLTRSLLKACAWILGPAALLALACGAALLDWP